MGDPSLIEKYITWPISHFVRNIEYYFAKRWLDNTFGKHEYWGEVIGELLSKDEAKKINYEKGDSTRQNTGHV